MTERARLERQKKRLATWLYHQIGERPNGRIRADKRYLRLLAVIDRLRVLNSAA